MCLFRQSMAVAAFAALDGEVPRRGADAGAGSATKLTTGRTAIVPDGRLSTGVPGGQSLV
jgi:hypothetical protein